MKKPTAYHGWKGDDGRFYVSMKPRQDNWPRNACDTAIEVLAMASQRGLSVIWEDPSVIDGGA